MGAAAMTTEQIKLWRELHFDEPPQPSGDQTPEQAANLRIVSFCHTCQFEGLPVPSEDEVRAFAPW